jgi:hypothetical protein
MPSQGKGNPVSVAATNHECKRFSDCKMCLPLPTQYIMRGGTNRREEEKYRHLNKDTNTIFIP